MLFLELTQCTVPQLTNPLSSDSHHPANLLQGTAVAIVQPEVEPEHLGVPGRERGKCRLQIAGSAAGEGGRIGPFLRERNEPLQPATILTVPHGLVQPQGLHMQGAE